LPKLVATLASLLLIASAIGTNIARYPQVGRTLETGPRTDSAEPAKPAPEESSRVEIANPDSLAASKFEVEPAKPPQVVAVAPPKTARVEETVVPKPAPAADADRLKPESVVSILDVRPIVPVAGLRATGETDPLPGSEEMRRLPPVEPSGPAVAEIQTAGSHDALPYVATSTP